jgi:hypothetical protein
VQPHGLPSPASSQEDELAVNVLSAGTSPYMPLTFMTDEPSFRPYFSFKEAPPAARQRWIDCFRYFLRKLSLRAGGRCWRSAPATASSRPRPAVAAKRHFSVCLTIHCLSIHTVAGGSC